MVPTMRRLLRWLGSVLVVTAIFIAIRTAQYGSDKLPAVEAATRVELRQGAAERLAGAIRIPTVSSDERDSIRGNAFGALHAHLQECFPRIHAQLTREMVGGYSLLITWPGKNTSLRPILLAAHQDVVPIEPGTDSLWKEEPFSGVIADGFIWGRGTIDDKSAVMGTLEAVEMLLVEGFQPERTVYLAFGHDEELGGAQGAREIAALLKSRGVELEMVLDEGGVIGDGLLPDISSPIALVGIAEKGFVNLELTAQAEGGHASMPPKQTTVGVLSAAIARIEQKPMPARLAGPVRLLFDRIGPYLPPTQRSIFANLWLTRPLVLRALEKSSTTNALVRTTMAATMFQAGTKDNVLASRARAVLNCRIAPGDSIQGVLDYVRRVVADDRITMSISGESSEPSPISDPGSQSFQQLEHAVRSIDTDVIVAPYLVVAGTDARYYAEICPHVFRFLPVQLSPSDLERIHGANERVAVSQYEDAIRIYRELLLTATAR